MPIQFDPNKLSNVEKTRLISDENIKKFSEYKLVVVRERNTNLPLNVSYTIDGLKFTYDKVGRLVPIFLENGLVSENYIIEEYVPMNHIESEEQFTRVVNKDKKIVKIKTGKFEQRLNNKKQSSEVYILDKARALMSFRNADTSRLSAYQNNENEQNEIIYVSASDESYYI